MKFGQKEVNPFPWKNRLRLRAEGRHRKRRERIFERL